MLLLFAVVVVVVVVIAGVVVAVVVMVVVTPLNIDEKLPMANSWPYPRCSRNTDRLA